MKTEKQENILMWDLRPTFVMLNKVREKSWDCLINAILREMGRVKITSIFLFHFFTIWSLNLHNYSYTYVDDKHIFCVTEIRFTLLWGKRGAVIAISVGYKWVIKTPWFSVPQLNGYTRRTCPSHRENTNTQKQKTYTPL